jgi:hypothetical protein
MAESLTSAFLEEKNKEINYITEFNSSEYKPEHFGVGGVTSKVLEEIHEEQDEWEIFFTTMFFLGIVLIPLQLIFADDIKPYDAYLLKLIQENIIYFNDTIISYFTIFVTFLSTSSNVRFLSSITVFFYLCFDPGVAYKTALVAGCGSYIVFILKLIIHDARPYWVYPDIEPGLCRISFGCPSLDVFIGMLYSHYIFFCTTRALKSKDAIVRMNRNAIEVSKIFSIILIICNIFVGILYTILGENFIYQIFITFFYGFILIRIVIIFNKDIDHFANGSRFVKQISNVSVIVVMFTVTTLAIAACIIYEVVNKDLLIPREWTANIAKYCPNYFESNELSIRMTFLDSTSIFHIFGATVGVNIVLKHIDKPFVWFVTDWWQRLLRGLLGACVNMIIISFTSNIR